jgi:hypothetical protein
MAIRAYWDNPEQTTLVIEINDPWEWTEMYEAVDEGVKMIDGVNHTVDVITDWRNHKHFPPDMFTHARNLTRKRHERAGVNALVGMHPTFMPMWHVFSRAYSAVVKQHPFWFIDTMEEAREKLAQARQNRA